MRPRLILPVLLALALALAAARLLRPPPPTSDSDTARPTEATEAEAVAASAPEPGNTRQPDPATAGAGPDSAAATPVTTGTAAGPSAAPLRATFAHRVHPFAYAEELEVRARPGTPEERTRLLRTKFKYPLLRVEEHQETSGAFVFRRAMVADHVMVKTRDGVTDDQFAARVRQTGMTIRKKMGTPNLYLVAVPRPSLGSVPTMVEVYSRMTDVVAYAEPDYIVTATATTPNDPRFGDLWAMRNIGQTGGTLGADISATLAWDQETGSGSMVIGVIDTGVDYNHEDLAANMWTNPGEIPGNNIDDDSNGYIDDVHGWDFANDDADPIDDNRHGTHVSGTIAAVGNNATGVVGVNWNAQIMALKFLNASGSGAGSDAIDAQNYANMMQQQGVNIRLTSNSWGGGGFQQGMKDAITAAAARDMLFVAAAGNDANDNDAGPSYPGSYDVDNIISVAATDHNDALASFSNYGATTVDLSAPGVGILSTTPNDSYDTFQGTSMACPHVAGAAALLWDGNPSIGYAEVRNAILAGVDAVPALSGVVASGGRLNLHNALLQLGMLVRGSTPANGEVVGSPPTTFIVRFSDDYDTNTVAASDLVVNGIPAGSVALTASDTLTFSYFSSPATAQGVQQMFMASNAVARASDGSALKEWQAHFLYDLLRMNVVSTEPANGTVAVLPFTNLLVNLNETVDPSSVNPFDLLMSQGSIDDAVAEDADTVRFTLRGITNEGLLTVRLPEGAFSDSFGNPSESYEGQFTLDFGTVPFPATLRALEPLGSLVFDPPVQGSIIPAGDDDSFVIDLDGDQCVSVLVHPAAGLSATVEFRNPADSLLGSASSPAAGRAAVLSSVPIPAGGAYKITVAGNGATTGSYDLEVVLNAAVEAETYGGATNDTIATAESIDASIILPAGGVLERAAVVGHLDLVPIYEERFDNDDGGYTVDNAFGSGNGLWHLSTGRQLDGLPGHTPTNSFYYGQNEDDTGNGDYNTGTANGGALYSPPLALPLTEGLTLSFNYLLGTEGDSRFDVVEVAVDAGSGYQVLLSSRNGSLPTSTGGRWQTGYADLSAYAGQSITLRFSFDTLDDFFNEAEGWYLDDIAIGAPLEVDVYAVTLTAFATAEFALMNLRGGNLDMELYSPGGALLAESFPAANSTRILNGFMATADAPYYLRVSGGFGDYALVATRNGAFEREYNNTPGDPQFLTRDKRALGHVASPPPPLGSEEEPNDDGVPGGSIDDISFANDWSTSFTPAGGMQWSASLVGEIAAGNDNDWDFFRLLASPGDTLDLTLTGADGAGGTLADPLLRLYDNTGAELAMNDDIVSGLLDSQIIYSNFTYAGAYYAVADSWNSEQGTYTLAATLTTGGLLPAGDPDSFLVSVSFGDDLTISTLTPGDGPRAFENLLDPQLRLYDPSDSLVASDNNSAPDGRNALLTHTTGQTGLYRVEVDATVGSRGEYVLDVAGASGSPPQFRVVETVPPLGFGELTGAGFSNIVVAFSAPILLTSLQPGDLTVNATAATSVTLLDAQTASFTFAPPGDGVHTLSIDFGAIDSLDARSVVAFSGDIQVDGTAPRISSSSVQDGDVIFADLVQFDFEFDEAIATAEVGPEDVLLIGSASGPHQPDSFSVNSSDLSVFYNSLPDDFYTLTILSGDTHIEDAAGNALDGEALSFPIPPAVSGDGTPGGDFVVSFAADVFTTEYPGPLALKSPAGGLVYDPTVSGAIQQPADQDAYTIELDPGQTLTVMASPESTLRPRIDILDPLSSPQASASASATGAVALAQTVSVNQGGTWTVRFSGEDGSVGTYSARLYLNAALEEETYGGASNGSAVGAEDITASFINLGAGMETRGAVVGHADDDWYMFPLAAGELNSLVLTAVSPSGSSLELYDTNGTTLLASGVPGSEAGSLVIADYAIGAGGDFFARVQGTGDYSLIIVRDAAFDWTENSTYATAQDISIAGTVLGYLGSAMPEPPITTANVVGLPLTLTDGDGFQWPIAGDGAIVNDTAGAYDEGHRHVSFPPSATGNDEDGGREIVIGPSNVGGLTVTRKIFVPADQSYARFLEIVTNPAPTPTNYVVDLSTDLGSDLDTVVVNSSNGDATYTEADTWVVTDDSIDGGGTPAILHVTSGQGAPEPTLAFQFQDIINAGFDLPLDPGETKIVMHFGAQSSTRFEALLKASTLVAPPPEVLAGMSGAERAQVVNFDLPPPAAYFGFMASAGDAIVLTTATPFDGPGSVDNLLDPALELFNPQGVLVESDSDSLDGRNALISHAAQVPGEYRARVNAQNESGEYVLRVSGHSGSEPPDLAVSLRQTPLGVSLNCDFTLLVTVTNLKEQQVSGAVVTLPPDPSLDVVFARTFAGEVVSTNPVVWNLGLLGGNSFAEVELRLSPTATGSITNTATVGSPLPDADPSNNVASVVTFVGPAVPSGMGPVFLVPGSPLVADPPPGGQNNIGESFDFNLAGNAAISTFQCGFGSPGSVYANYDANYLYLGGLNTSVAQATNVIMLFIGVNTLSENALTLAGRSGMPGALDISDNISFATPMDLAILVGSEDADGTFPAAPPVPLGQGFYRLGATSFPILAGPRLAQYDGFGSFPTASPDDDGNALVDRWEARIPWSSLNATNVLDISFLRLAGALVTGSTGTSPYVSGNYLGSSAAGILDEFNNFGVGNLHLAGLSFVLPDTDNDGLPDWWEQLHGLDPGDDGSTNIDNGPDGDPDNDHVNNRDEAIALTDPMDPASVFRSVGVEPPAGPGPGPVAFTVATEPGMYYIAEYNDVDLGPASWTPFANTANGVGTWVETSPTSTVFAFVDDFTPGTSGGPPPAGVTRSYRARAYQP